MKALYRVPVLIERGLDGSFDANMAFDESIPFGLLGQGYSVPDTIADFYRSYEDIKALYAAEGKKAPVLDFDFRYDMPSFLQYYAYAFTLAGLERITGVNQKQLGHYISGVRKPSEKTVRKIEERIHAFGREIAAVQFA